MGFTRPGSTPFIDGIEINLKHLYSQLEKHESSVPHDDACKAYLNITSGHTINNALLSHRQKSVELNREIVTRIIDISLLIGKQGLAFRIESLHFLDTDSSIDSNTSSDARFLLEKWTSFEYILTSFIFLEIFHYTTPASKYLQSKELDFITVINLIKSLISDLKKGSSKYDLIVEKTMNFISSKNNSEHIKKLNIVIEETFPDKRRSKIKKIPGELASDDIRNISNVEYFKVNTHRRIYDVLITTFENRFEKNEKLYDVLSILNPKRFKDFAKNPLLINDENLTFIAQKSNIESGNTLKEELLQFISFYNQNCIKSITNNTINTENTSENSAESSDDIFENSCQYTENKEDSESTDLDHSYQREVTTSVVPTSGDDRSTTSRSVTPSTIGPQPKRKKKLTPTDEVMQLAGQQLKAIRPDDEFEAYGKYIAHKLRSLKGNQAVYARKLINDVIFEGELEALTKDFKVMNSQPHHTFETNDLLQFNPQLYHPTYLPRIFEHQLSTSQHLSNMTMPSSQHLSNTATPTSQHLSNTAMPNSQHLSDTTPPISHTNEPEQDNSKQPNMQQPESQLPEIQPLIYSNYMPPSSSKTINTDLNQSMENNVSSFFSKFI
ncbi:hypothetical protein ACI65C_013739 [Semiaphis heraclei]